MNIGTMILKKLSPAAFLLAIFSFSFQLVMTQDTAPDIQHLEFGQIKIDGVDWDKDVVIDKGVVSQRKKGPSRELRVNYGHTPLTQFEKIPWDCEVLLIGKGMSGRLPITEEFKAEAKKNGVELIIMETPAAVKYFKKNYHSKMNAIFHITC
ncbi:hypothetical protein JYT74_00355 [Crocinitomix catalasitica]|nr:hypothetical protein [Crocinitomix catalasitica]